ncbi:serine hydrolase FSH [Podospora fimiseda]|uniref:Serine hydrolase FSH n=1 Tax=Podospora fimiseda TaxID=252190 RepID=A0AAN7BIC6_9PEZI|nr:serine hydrolase FSH [Podospora fimiseda]
MTHSPTATLNLPRILCFHGGGTNSDVFRAQMRGFMSRTIIPHFRFVFVNGPYECPPHPAIIQVYGEYAPFYRWLRWKEEHDEVDTRTCSAQILTHIRRAMDDDEGDGDWVGVLGFSQGAKIAASLLWLQERRGSSGIPFVGREVRFRFGVLMAGSAPIVMLDPTGECGNVPRYIETADNLALNFTDWPDDNVGEHVVTLPTLHVHGLLDEGIERHRKLLKLYCKEGTTKLFEWMGDHRLPIKSTDVAMIMNKILEMAQDMGVL